MYIKIDVLVIYYFTKLVEFRQSKLIRTNYLFQTKDNTILDHIMEINAKHYLPLNNMIPTGNVYLVQTITESY